MFLLYAPEEAATASSPDWLPWVTIGYAVLAVPASVFARRAAVRKEPGQTPDGAQVTAAGRVTAAMFVGIAVAESGALMGFVLFVKTYALVPAIAAMIIGMVGVSLHIPTRRRWDSWLAALEDSPPGIIG